jgi:hypothetical protein
MATNLSLFAEATEAIRAGIEKRVTVEPGFVR